MEMLERIRSFRSEPQVIHQPIVPPFVPFEKGGLERQSVAERLVKVRNLEMGKTIWGFKNDRNWKEYVTEFRGVHFFLDYVRSLPGRSTVLDIGSGTTKGIHGLTGVYPFAHDIDFYATGLINHPGIKHYLGENKFFQTSVEMLSGIQDESISGMLGLYSIAYSAYPERAIQRIDEVLVPGGAVKATFNMSVESLAGMKTNRHFLPALEKRGYVIASRDFDRRTNVIVAIKPGGNKKADPEKLLTNDAKDFLRVL